MDLLCGSPARRREEWEGPGWGSVDLGLAEGAPKHRLTAYPGAHGEWVGGWV